MASAAVVRSCFSKAAAQTNADNNGLTRTMLLHGDLTARIINAFFHVYDVLGYGFLESVYRRALTHELRRRGLRVECEVLIQVWYDSVLVGHFKADMIVEDVVLVENKASERVTSADRKQLMNYLKGTNIQVGLLLHFGPRPGFQRVAYTNRAKPHQQKPLKGPR